MLFTARVECSSTRLPDALQGRLAPAPPSNEEEDVSGRSNRPTVPTELPCSLRAKGCITTNAFGIMQWYPDPCTLCDCNGCSEITCPQLDCFGFPIVKKSGKCCPECDFGVSKYNCSVVPAKIKSLYVSLGDKSCQSDIIIHECSQRFGFDERGHLFCCVPFETHHTHKLTQELQEFTGIYKIGYLDIGKCKKQSFDSLTPEEIANFLLHQLPQDVPVGREGNNGLPQRCVEYFATQQLQP